MIILILSVRGLERAYKLIRLLLSTSMMSLPFHFKQTCAQENPEPGLSVSTIWTVVQVLPMAQTKTASVSSISAVLQGCLACGTQNRDLSISPSLISSIHCKFSGQQTVGLSIP